MRLLQGMRFSRCVAAFWRTFGFVVTFVVLVSSSEELKIWENEFEDTQRSFKGAFHLLGECRRHLTFLASVALGAFITRVVKDSPLTPLPLPPLENPLRWNLVSLPAHVPFHSWIKRHPYGQTVHLNQGYGSLVESGSLFRSMEDIEPMSSKWNKELMRRFSKIVDSQDLVISAVQRTLKPLKFILPHALGIRRWLLRLCP